MPEQEKENVASSESLTSSGGGGVKMTASSGARDLGDPDNEVKPLGSPTPRELSDTLKKQHLKDDEELTIECDRSEESDTVFRVGVSEEERAYFLVERWLSPRPDESIHASEVSQSSGTFKETDRLEPEAQNISESAEPAALSPSAPSTNQPRAHTGGLGVGKPKTSSVASSEMNKEKALPRSKSVTKMLQTSAARARHVNDFIKVLVIIVFLSLVAKTFFPAPIARMPDTARH